MWEIGVRLERRSRCESQLVLLTFIHFQPQPVPAAQDGQRPFNHKADIYRQTLTDDRERSHSFTTIHQFMYTSMFLDSGKRWERPQHREDIQTSHRKVTADPTTLLL